MVSLVGRWRARGVRGGATGMPRSAGDAAAAGNSLALAFEQLCAQLKRPFSSAEIRAAAPPTEAGMTLGGILLAAERLGFKARQVKPRRRALAQMPTPFLLIGRRPGEGWLVARPGARPSGAGRSGAAARSASPASRAWPIWPGAWSC